MIFDDSKLRRVSISTNDFLFKSDFTVNENVYDLVTKLRNRYRIFLITQVDSEDSVYHKLTKDLIDKLVQSKVIKHHRAMYCTTHKGKEALVR